MESVIYPKNKGDFNHLQRFRRTKTNI